jgi:hypothetical protein
MKRINLLIAFCFGVSLSLTAQDYNFTATTGTYENLSGSTSLNNGITWDDPQFKIPIGFDFTYFDETFNQIFIEDFGLGGLLTPDSSESGVFPLLIAYGADIIDRAYDFIEPGPGSQSNISYLTEGTPGNRILKVEWNNVGFYSELEDDDVSTDFTNFQMWLYEGSNDIELRFGPNSITQPQLSFDDLPGSYIALLPAYEYDTDELLEDGIGLSGDPANPTLEVVSSLFSLPTLNGVIPEGTIYKFSPGMSNTSSPAALQPQLSVFPNPSKGFFQILSENQNEIMEQVTIVNSIGKVVKEVNNPGNSVSVSELPAGSYFVKIKSNLRLTTQKLVVE